MKIIHVVGARPNFMKAAPILSALDKHPEIEQQLVHTGQHYDKNMSDIFFEQLQLPRPDINLEVGSGSHAAQTAEIMKRFEKVVLTHNPDLLLVYGDVNSTIATALVASKLGVRIGHIEAGLRSFDRTMPEEINRVLTDQISDLFFTPSSDADDNLKREGIAPEKIFLVGNAMIDTLTRLLNKAHQPDIPGLKGPYVLMTMHRPSNVDDFTLLKNTMTAIEEISEDIQVIFPIHPRTKQSLKNSKLNTSNLKLQLIEPQGYLEFLWLQKNATAVVTDSGGIQEETTYMQVPCLTLRENTERPVTCSRGTNQLIGQDTDRLKREIKTILNGRGKRGGIPPLWDGHAGDRIAEIISRMV